ncbi:MAG: rhamnogalacturonan lyase [Luteolibacter sp.]
MLKSYLPLFVFPLLCLCPDAARSQDLPPRVMEWLGRGIVALETREGIFISWRVVGTDEDNIRFDVYRNDEKINPKPLEVSNYMDPRGKLGDRYYIEVVAGSTPLERSREVHIWPAKPAMADQKAPPLPFKEIPLNPPGPQYTPGDMSVGDLDGDGEYELIFEWEGPSPYLEAITLEGKSLWRISCGPNTDSTKLAFMVYDFDGDGKAEVALKTGPGTRDGTGRFLSKGPAASANHEKILKRSAGRLVEDPSYVTLLKGTTGEELATVDYWPPIGPMKDMNDTWGDNYGHRANSIKAAVLYQNGARPLMVFARGIYSRIAMASFRWDGTTLEKVWTFDTEDRKNSAYKKYRGQGNHALAVGDVDGDGSDEIIYGACAIDHDGKGLYTTGLGHGDSHALGDLMPDRPGLEFFQGHEGGDCGVSMRDAGTGEILWTYPSKADVGRSWAAAVDPNYRGVVCASSASPNLDANGKIIDTKYNPYFYPIYFDGDVQRELRNRTAIELGPSGRIFQGWYYGAATVHSTKNDACLVADILGDWREEVIFRRNDNKALLVFTTWLPTERRNYTLMHDPIYRMNIVVQNIGYNQVAHTGYYFPDGAPKPNIRYLHR